jgi:hypothetical protein
LESIAEARIDNVSFETKVSDVEFDQRDGQSATKSSKVCEFQADSTVYHHGANCAGEAISTIKYLCEFEQGIVPIQYCRIERDEMDMKNDKKGKRTARKRIELLESRR